MFFVCLPPNGATVGQAWKAPFFGGAPLPADLEASYRYAGNSADKKFAIVEMKITAAGSSNLQARGKLFLRLSDGFLDHGNAVFEMSFIRPDLKDRSKLIVNSRVVIRYNIMPA